MTMSDNTPNSDVVEAAPAKLARELEALLAKYRKPDSTSADAFALRSHLLAHIDTVLAALSTLPSAEAGAEPVAWMYEIPGANVKQVFVERRIWNDGWTETPLYAAPPTEAAPVAGDEVERGAELVKRFLHAVADMPPEVGARFALNQQFNAYEFADNEEDCDPEWWDYQISIGPITDRRWIMDVEGQAKALLLESALKLASHTALAAIGPAPTEAAIRADEREKCAKILDAKAESYLSVCRITNCDPNIMKEARSKERLCREVASAIRSRGDA